MKKNNSLKIMHIYEIFYYNFDFKIHLTHTFKFKITILNLRVDKIFFQTFLGDIKKEKF